MYTVSNPEDGDLTVFLYDTHHCELGKQGLNFEVRLLILLMVFLLPVHFGRPAALRHPADKVVDSTVMCKIVVIHTVHNVLMV
jgi:hypothetical protein